MDKQGVTTEPQWKTAGPPYLLTQGELIQELQARGLDMSERRLRDWSAGKIIPRPPRRLPPGATDSIARVSYPAWMVEVLHDLIHLRNEGAALAELKRVAPERIHYWQQRSGDAPQVRDAVERRRTSTGSTPAFPATVAARPHIPRRLQLAIWGYAARLAERNSIKLVDATLTLTTEDGTKLEFRISPVPGAAEPQM